MMNSVNISNLIDLDINDHTLLFEGASNTLLCVTGSTFINGIEGFMLEYLVYTFYNIAVEGIEDMLNQTDVPRLGLHQMVVCHTIDWYIFPMVIFFIFLVIKMLTCLKHCRENKENDSFKMIKRQVLKITGDENASCDDVNRCIQMLKQFPELINSSIDSHKNTPFLRACYAGKKDLVEHMLNNGADLTIKNKRKECPMHMAVIKACETKKWDPSVLNLLYDAGCSLGNVTVRGLTVLHIAAQAGQVTLAQWLLYRKAHVKIRCMKMMYTPYDIAISYGDVNHLSIAALLHLYCPEWVERGRKIWRPRAVPTAPQHPQPPGVPTALQHRRPPELPTTPQHRQPPGIPTAPKYR